jgi:PAS domain S-box-containing protein
MSKLPRTEKLSYLWSAVAVAVAFGIRFALSSWFSGDALFFLYVPAVAIAAWGGGIMPGIFAIFLSLGAGIAYELTWPTHPLNFEDRIRFALFAFCCSVVIYAIQSLRKALRREIVARPVVEVAGAKPRFESSQDRGLRLILDNSLDVAIITMDQNHLVREWNAGATQITGYSRGEMLGKSADVLFSPSDLESGEPRHEQLLAEATGQTAIYRWMRHKDGELFLAEGTLRPMPLQLNESQSFIKVFTDVTSRSRQYDEAKAMLMEKAQDAEVLLYSMAHDMRQYSRGLSVNATLLARDLEGIVPEENTKALDRLRENGTRMHGMVEGILEHLRLVRSPVKPSPVNLSEVAELCAAHLRRDNPACTNHFIVQPGLWVKGDRELLSFVFDNLFNNAAKYAPGTRVIFGRDAAKEAYYVRDEGPGFDPQYQERVFRLFERLHGQDKPGTGIGLSNVRRIIERHGGKVWAETQQGQGATFYFTLKSAVEELAGSLR